MAILPKWISEGLPKEKTKKKDFGNEDKRKRKLSMVEIIDNITFEVLKIGKWDSKA